MVPVPSGTMGSLAIAAGVLSRVRSVLMKSVSICDRHHRSSTTSRVLSGRRCRSVSALVLQPPTRRVSCWVSSRTSRKSI
uniref:Putative secreted protein n=1 Tax=Anopheles darlingi TaxID=43151 RepID=A0A2M4D257_ANODA